VKSETVLMLEHCKL